MDYKSLREVEVTRQYMSQMRPLLRKNALFSDGTPDYRIPAEPKAFEIVQIRFRAAKNNIDAVWLISKEIRVLMKEIESDELFDYYEAKIPLEDKPFLYNFEIEVGRLRCYYNKRGVSKDLDEYYDFCITPGFAVPEWSKGAVIYQIYVDRFCNGDPTNDVETKEYYYIKEGVRRVEDWYRLPASMDVRDFYGGDLQGVFDKLDYLQNLGIEVIYFNPLFVSPSNHKYDIQDYDYIDPHIGKIVNDCDGVLAEGVFENFHAKKYIKRVTDKENLEASNQLFIRLVEAAHQRGIKVILDGVFNHSGSFNKWLDREMVYEQVEGYEKGAYVSGDSPYRNYYHFAQDNIWPFNPTYDGWWGHETLPKLNYEGSKELQEYILSVGAKWVSPPFNADGWRLDVAADLGYSIEFNHEFWKRFRKAVKSANPEAIILAENYGDSSDWLQGDEWDTVMNYDAFMEPISWFLTGMEKHSDEYSPTLDGNLGSFKWSMTHYMSRFHTTSLHCAMNELSNHDHSRFLTRTNKTSGRVNYLGGQAANEGVNKGVLKEAVVIQMTWPGCPTIYYGDEVGLCGFTDPDNRRTYPWGREDTELLDFHRDIIKLHKKHKVLKTGSIMILEGDDHLLSYGRFNREEQILVMINNRDEDAILESSVWLLGVGEGYVMEQIMFTIKDGYSITPVDHHVVKGKIKLNLLPHSSIILKAKKIETE